MDVGVTMYVLSISSLSEVKMVFNAATLLLRRWSFLEQEMTTTAFRLAALGRAKD